MSVECLGTEKTKQIWDTKQIIMDMFCKKSHILYHN